MKEMIMSASEIHSACVKIAKELDNVLLNEEKTPLVLSVMKGGMNFTVDLTREMKTDILIDYIHVSSYDRIASTGKISLKKDIEDDLEGRTLIIVDDVVDSGLSMRFLLDHIKRNHNPKRILIVALIDKQGARDIDIQVDYCGLVLKENKFLVGYGLDYLGMLRNVPYIYVPSAEEIERWDYKLSNEYKKNGQ